MNTSNKTLKLVKMALIVAVYVAVTGILAPISFGNLNFRLSEVLILLVFVDSAYIIPLTLGCIIANYLFTTMGMVDVVCGSLATFITLALMIGTKKLLLKEDGSNMLSTIFIGSVWASIVNGLVVGAELFYVLQFPFWLSVVQVAVGEFVVVSIVGTVVIKSVLSNKALKEKLVIG